MAAQISSKNSCFLALSTGSRTLQRTQNSFSSALKCSKISSGPKASSFSQMPRAKGVVINTSNPWPCTGSKYSGKQARKRKKLRSPISLGVRKFCAGGMAGECLAPAPARPRGTAEGCTRVCCRPLFIFPLAWARICASSRSRPLHNSEAKWLVSSGTATRPRKSLTQSTISRGQNHFRAAQGRLAPRGVAVKNQFHFGT